jgi:DNA polymerase (family 10)
MRIRNADVAVILTEIADLIEIGNGNPFRIRAYRNAARTVEMLAPSVQALMKEGRDLSELAGIGHDLAGRIAEIVHGGTCELREQLRRELPPDIDKLLRVPGLGPKRVKLLYDERGIHTPQQLLEAAQAGQLHTIHGLGEKAEQHLLEAVQAQLSKKKRFGIAEAARIVEPLVGYLNELPATVHVEAAGSYRRMKETVGDLDIVASSAQTAQVTQHFVEYGAVTRVLSHGDTRASIEVQDGVQVDLRVVEEASFGAALHYFTGSKAHNIEIRKLAQKRELKLNEYGMFSGEARVAGDTEESVFAALGLPFIEPELRENRGEVEAARDAALPHLVTLHDLRGDLHVHTSAGDGANTLSEMVLEAQRRGMVYLGISDRWQLAGAPGGLDEDKLARQIEEIDRLNSELQHFTVLKGVEIDILEDGSLGVPDSVLQRLDYVIAAVNSHFDLGKDEQTERILRAMDNRHVCILGHPMGRRLLARDAYDVDMGRVIHHARVCHCALELNAQPERLDLNDAHAMMARDEGVLVAICSDARGTADFDKLRFGIGQGRRGWLEKKNVLNARTLAQLRAFLKR